MRWSMWRTVRDTGVWQYQEHRWSKARRAVKVTDDLQQVDDAWLCGGEFGWTMRQM